MAKYDIYNPATARRIIHSGVAGSRPIEILPRETVQGVELADIIAERLIERNAKDPENELKLEFADDQPKFEAMKIKIDESKIDVVPSKGKRG